LEDDPADCDDGNPDIYPGAVGTNPACCCPSEMGPNSDYDCNGTPDNEEIETICEGTPIIVDIAGNGFSLTNKANGVRFDLNGFGSAEQIPWTALGSDDAWLALDRDGNGIVQNGRELFGNYTPQPPVPERNGFLALAVFDDPAAGGNGDSWIDRDDSVFGELRLWRDANHDGVSQASELRTLSATGIRRLSLDYRESLRSDRWGNWFRYGAKVVDGRNRDIGLWAFDVFLGAKPPKPHRPVRR
jgi:hypothetical protein